jgi:elongation factor G
MTHPSRDIPLILSFAIGSVNDKDSANLLREFDVLVHEDPAIRVEVSLGNEELVISGEDELQLMEAHGRILLKYKKYKAEIGELRINYRETIRTSAEAEGKYIRQTGGSGNYGHCKICVEPNEPGKGYQFINHIKGAAFSKEYIEPVDQGIRGAMEQGILAGFPVVDVKATLYDGSYHEADSNEMAFKIAGSIAFKEAARKASPVLLEPVMAMEITVPEEFIGTVIGDINSRRGRIEGMEHTAGSQMIRAIVPLAEVLTSSARGRPRYSMRLQDMNPLHRASTTTDPHTQKNLPAPGQEPARLPLNWMIRQASVPYLRHLQVG